MSPPRRSSEDDHVEAAIENLTALVNTVREEVEELAETGERTNATLTDLKVAIQGTDPLGGGSLAIRFNNIDGAIGRIDDAMKQFATRVTALEASELEERKDKRRSGVQLWVSGISALAAIVCAIIALLAHKGAP